MEQPEARQEEAVAMQEDTKPTGTSAAHLSIKDANLHF
jgi:hypothetical protein